MNKKMRDLFAQMEQKAKEARAAQDAGESEKAAGLLAEADTMKKQYETEKRLYEYEQQKVPEDGAHGSKAVELTGEEKSFLEFCQKGAGSLAAGSNGAVIPTTIADKIIETVRELSPVMDMATRYSISGNLIIPAYGKDGGDEIQASYGSEFVDLTEHAGKFTSVELGSNMVGSLTKISKKLIVNASVDSLGFVIGQVARAFSEFFEKELLVGTGETGHMTGATTTTNVLTASAATVSAITADLLIDAQLSVPQAYQGNAVWIMNKDVLKAVRKLKNSDGDYLLTKSLTESFSWDLLGKPVYISENMPAVAASSVPILYGDMSGMAFKLSKALELQVLLEKYAAQYAVGVVGWAEADSKIENAQKFVAIKMKAS